MLLLNVCHPNFKHEGFSQEHIRYQVKCCYTLFGQLKKELSPLVQLTLLYVPCI